MPQTLGPGDAEEAAALHARCFPDPWSAASLAEAFGDTASRALGFREGGALVAFALTKEVAGEADLLTIATDPAVRRRGLAAELVGALIVELERAGITRLTLEVAEDNLAARGLYGRFGFTEDGRRPRYYVAGRDVPADAVLMSRRLGV